MELCVTEILQVPKAISAKDLWDKHLGLPFKNAVVICSLQLFHSLDLCPTTKDLTLKNSWGNRPDKIHPKKPKEAKPLCIIGSGGFLVWCCLSWRIEDSQLEWKFDVFDATHTTDP